jgi:hypothetical protein
MLFHLHGVGSWAWVVGSLGGGMTCDVMMGLSVEAVLWCDVL